MISRSPKPPASAATSITTSTTTAFARRASKVSAASRSSSLPSRRSTAARRRSPPSPPPMALIPSPDSRRGNTPSPKRPSPPAIWTAKSRPARSAARSPPVGDEINGVSLLGGQSGDEYDFGKRLPASLGGNVADCLAGSRWPASRSIARFQRQCADHDDDRYGRPIINSQTLMPGASYGVSEVVPTGLHSQRRSGRQRGGRDRRRCVDHSDRAGRRNQCHGLRLLRRAARRASPETSMIAWPARRSPASRCNCSIPVAPCSKRRRPTPPAHINSPISSRGWSME